MTHLMDLRQAKILASIVSGIFFLIHILMLVIFSLCKVTPMVIVNIFSIMFYMLSFLMINRSYLREYCLLVYLEVVIHMSAAVLFTGWDGGFQVTLIGISFLIFYSEYVGRYLRIPVLPSLPICSIGMAAYIGTCIINYYITPAYPLSDVVSFRFRIYWGVVVFVVSLFFLYLFIKLASGSEELLARRAGHDQLTGLPNRYYMAECLETMELENGLEDHWVAMLDIDDFKGVNDTYGHNCGDYVLKELAYLLQEWGAGIEICRWGGEEFLLLGKLEGEEGLKGEEGPEGEPGEPEEKAEEPEGEAEQEAAEEAVEKKKLEQCRYMLENLRKTVIRHDFRYENQHLDLTVTIGCVRFRPGLSFRQCVDAADKNLYVGKHNGKNQVVFEEQV